MSEFARQEDQYKPRERMLTAASAAELRADELLAILLRTGTAGCDVMELSRRILASYPSIEELVKSDWRTLWEHVREYNASHLDKPIKGLGKLKMIELAAAFELVRRGYDAQKQDVRKLTVSTAEAAYKLFRQYVQAGDEQEVFYVLPVDSRCHPLSEPIRLMKGLADASLVHPREVFREAIRWGAHALFVAHNHPHGDASPSEADHNVTRQLIETSYAIGIPLLDHLVIGSSRTLSGRRYASIRASCPELFDGKSV